MFRLFIVEDDENIREGLKYFCNWQEMGIEAVGSALDGVIGLEQILAQEIDIVLTDVKMPHMDGLEMSRALRDAGWDGELIFLSAYSEIENFKVAISVNADDYLLKPFDDEQLREAVMKAVRKLEERRDYAKLLRHERWNRILRGDEDNVPCGPYAVSFLHAPQRLEEILPDLQQPRNILWADKLTATEAAIIWIKVDDADAIRRQADDFVSEWISRDIEISCLTSEPAAESWRITALLQKLKDRFSIAATVLPDPAGPESLDALAGQIVSGILSGSAPSWVDAHREEIWSGLCGCGAQTIRELLDNSILLIQMLARTSGSESHKDFCEKWRRKACLLLLECGSAKEVRHVILTCLKTLNIFFTENSGVISSLNRLRETILQNLQEISLPLLVEKTGLSKWTITKIIRAECGLSVNEFIQNIRLEEARRMLLETDLKIYEISAIVGYTSVDYFTSIFRSKYSLTPQQSRSAGSAGSQSRLRNT